MTDSKPTGKFKRLRDLVAIASGVFAITIAAAYTGFFQTLEWSTLDLWFRLRPTEPRESRIVVVTIDESDISQIGQWSLSDETLSKLITKISQQKPRVIGLDIYRDLPIEPGTEKLAASFSSTPNLIGIEKVIGQQVKPPPILKEQGQTALSDLILDADGKVRRGLLSVRLNNGQVQLSLAARLALMYLAEEGIYLKPVNNTTERSLGKATLVPFKPNDGGYIRADAGGFQISINYRGIESSFDRISIVDVLNGDIPPNLMRDRLVLIGATAPSLNDFFATPFRNDLTNQPEYLPGVFIHANLASQIISEALDGRTAIKVVSEPVEWLWVFVWSFAGSAVSMTLLYRDALPKKTLLIIKLTGVSLFVIKAILFASSYLLFVLGWWLPVIPSLLSIILSILIVSIYHNQTQQRLAYIDGLTRMPNRRYFDLFLAKEWLKSQKNNHNLSLILCDVDYFKNYNDTYGHQDGDSCLQQVAQVISTSVRADDLAARYGGEEFVIVLCAADAKVAMMVGQRVCDRLRDLKIPHQDSQVSKYVSISCGVASTSVNSVTTSADLVAKADLALYQAKERGRDRAFLAD